MATPLPSQAQSVSEMDRLIRAAIVGRLPLRAIYDGRERLLCPHMLGRIREGRVQILCLQIDGESARGLQRNDGHPDWRCLALEKFSNVRLAESASAWQTGGRSLRRPKCMDRIELEGPDQPEGEPHEPQ